MKEPLPTYLVGPGFWVMQTRIVEYMLKKVSDSKGFQLESVHSSPYGKQLFAYSLTLSNQKKSCLYLKCLEIGCKKVIFKPKPQMIASIVQLCQSA